ncbi:MAG TPA: DUF559 domain-containing protein [Acidimicrobiia bacterium]|nr:DUF559 domain-containing protein [Acidimicrobiia bacterium]
MNNIQIVSKIAKDQHGIVSRFQLVKAGITPGSIAALIRNHTITAIGRGVYTTLGAQSTWHQKAMVAVLSCGPSAMLSHVSALINCELLANDFSRTKQPNINEYSKIHVISMHRIRSVEYCIHHLASNRNHFKGATRRNGILQVCAERALIDSARQLTSDQLDFAVEKALFKKWTTPERLMSAVQASAAAPGREKKRIEKIVSHYLASDAIIGVESFLEKKVERVLRTCLTLPYVGQHNVTVEGKHYRLDFAIPSKMIAIEVDGYDPHRRRAVFDRDKFRDNNLANAGWKVLHITSVFTEEEIKTCILRALKS